tara:strand:+ start:550 stop:1224 length:675 start_codon:yes stop_codon:yes gene_type:complete
MNKIFFFVIVSLTSIFGQSLNMSGYNSDPLSETPLYPIPSEMSFEEYKDMNRRLSQALGWSAIPIPGITHYYAGEKKMAKRIFYVGLGGIAAIIAGASMNGEVSWPDTSTSELRNRYAIYDINTEDESWYRKIPVSIEGGETNYRLQQIQKESDNNEGGGLIFLGALILVGDFIYDRIWGIKKIEDKRDKVRFKYGQQLKFSLTPNINPYNNQYSLSLSKGFDF